MLKSFKVKGFKNFKNELHFNLSSGNYEYNLDGIENGIVKNSLIYGDNASGKTNLGLALMDIVSHLTDKHIRIDEYDRHYLNLDANEEIAEFEYIFKFGQDELIYTYKKTGFRKLVEERLLINNN
ncbi:TPA: AAA family ATPase, partial [Streptococcus suis]